MQSLRARIIDAAPYIVLAGAAVMLFAAQTRWSTTYDEPFHLTRGLAFWQTGSAQLSVDHPPLANALGTLLPFALEPGLPLSDLPSWSAQDAHALAGEHFGRDFKTARKQLLLARFSILTVWLFFGVWLCRRISRATTNLASPVTFAVGYGFLPAVSAHAALLTTDMIFGLSCLATLIALADFAHGRKRRQACLLGFWLGLAGLTKHSWPLLFFFVLTVVGFLGAKRLGRYHRFELQRVLRTLTADVLLIVLAFVVVVDTGFFFDRVGVPLGETVTALVQAGRHVPSFIETLARVAPWLVNPLPLRHLDGLLVVLNHVNSGHPAYLLGEVRHTGWWYYFPVLLVAKLPLAFLVMVAAAACARLRRNERVPAEAVVAYIFSAVYFLVAMQSKMNIGFRHLLPSCLALLFAASFELPSLFPRVRLLLLGSIVIGALSAWPDYLGDFSVLAGGPARGAHVSVVGDDWGQGVNELATWLEHHHVASLHFQPYVIGGIAELETHHIAVSPLGCQSFPPSGAWIAVHQALFVRSRDCYPWLAVAKREAVVGHVVVFSLPPNE